MPQTFKFLSHDESIPHRERQIEISETVLSTTSIETLEREKSVYQTQISALQAKIDKIDDKLTAINNNLIK